MAAAADDSSGALRPLAFVSVFYNPDDVISYTCAWLALVPQALLVTYGISIYIRRDFSTVYLLTGQLLCEMLNWLLKQLIHEERPTTILGDGYGMPSSHAQFVTFFATSSVINYYSSTKGSSSRRLLIIQTFLIIVIASAVTVSRVYLNYHSVAQVSAGAFAGMVFAVLWMFLLEKLRASGIIDWVLVQTPAMYLCLMDIDLYDVHSLIDREWKQRQSAAAKQS